MSGFCIMRTSIWGKFHGAFGRRKALSKVSNTAEQSASTYASTSRRHPESDDAKARGAWFDRPSETPARYALQQIPENVSFTASFRSSSAVQKGRDRKTLIAFIADRCAVVYPLRVLVLG